MGLVLSIFLIYVRCMLLVLREKRLEFEILVDFLANFLSIGPLVRRGAFPKSPRVSQEEE